MHRPDPTFPVNGAAIRARRMQAGLGTGEAAGLAGISERYLNHLENGYRTRMRPKSYAALRTALGLAPDDEQLLATPPHDEDQPDEQR
ncbi:helix-turn-helix transcriptional regulator [Streptomyces sp. SAJ15]|uniref:helix-turn-helix domain-containing protein n=1 Tax=Streptomyces sp. SAJ15 TaxID=2011095 RepID=UPI001185A867|nr:helix-turn-helix transcriptional regulator [Streptomyces sp. SAJ15]TVL89832.1 transcriptional regulator [Streptomyces sp. SAJ15]